VGLHFIPPVPDVPVAELVVPESASPEAVEVAKNFAQRLDKKVLHIHESAGLVNPRALITLVNEAAYMIDEGVCDAAAAELIIKESWGMSQGPLEMADRLGLDLILSWMEQAAGKTRRPLRSLSLDSALCAAKTSWCKDQVRLLCLH